MKILFFFAACFLWLVLGDYGCNPNSEQDIFSSNCSSIIFEGVRSFNLTKLIKIQHREVFNMVGDVSITSIHCIGNAGMFISHIKNVNLKNVQFHECGFHHYLYDTSFSSAVLILNSTNITIRSVCFYHTNGVGLVLLNSSGHINIYNSCFEQGEALEITGNYTGGGGGGGGIHIQQNGTDELTDVTITIQNTNFTNNAAKTQCKPTACNYFCSFGYGGGLTIALRNYSHSADITIDNCHFINNSAYAGGGIEIILCNSPDTNLDLNTVEFSRNKASKEGGGGIDILWSKSIFSKTRINFEKVIFLDNYGQYGGAVAIAIDSPDVVSGRINFIDCYWDSNTALYGSALDILHKQRAGKFNNHILQIENCNFTNNSNCYQTRDEKLIQRGYGMISVTGLTLVYKGTIQFSGNYGPVMYVVETSIKFDEAIVHFERNVAEYGSCIALTGRSVIIVNNNSAIHFYNNWAQFGSPTIFHLDLDENQNIESRRYAFKFVVSDGANSSFFYCGNTLPQDGQYLDGKMKDDTSLAKILNEVSELNATLSDKCDPNNSFKPTPASSQVCPDTKQQLGNINFIPGISKTIAQFNYSLLLRVSLFRSGSVSVEVPEIYEYITNKLMLYGKPGSNVTVYLHDQSIQGLHYIFTGILVACPPFYLLTEDNKCKCYDEKVARYKYFYTCTTTAQNSSFSSILPGYWIGLGNSLSPHNASILVGICPTGYCARDLSNDYLIIPYYDGSIEQEDLDKVLCNNRQGVLCGSCSNGTVVYFHSHNYKCGLTDKCHMGILFLLLSEIFPVTAIFLALIFFNIKLTAGGISGFIFFAQMYESVSIKLENNILYGLPFKYTVFHHVFYQLFNFEFIEIDSLSFCLWKGLTTLDILAVKYAMSAYALLLILVTTFIAKYCGRFKFASNKCRKYSIVQVFSTFIVIVYSKCTLISFSLLWYQDLYQGQMSVHKVVSLQGVVTLFDEHHLPYAIAAIAVLIFFIIPLPVLLIFYPLANKWILRLKIDNFFLVKIMSRLFPLFKLLPLFDSFQGIFKEKYRFFSGLYFVYRILILTSLFALDVSTTIYMICTLQFIVILLIHTLSWPYKQRIHNVIDALLLANLAIISGLKLAMISLIKYNSKIIQLVHGIEIILVNVPIVVLLIYVLIKFFHLFVKFFRKAPDNISDVFLTDDVRTSDHYYMKLS